MDKNAIQVNSDIKLKAAANGDFAAVASWFEPVTKAQKTGLVRQWAGPNTPNPLTVPLLANYIASGNYHSYVLIAQSNIVGFGQFQLVKERVHLARLIIKQEYRGQGLAKRLLSELIELAQAHIKVREVSLFVYADNIKAIKCYETYGFAESATPKGIQPLAGCRFMSLRY
jgi:ribosomal protein S18 acetylase RimI-like enzyme